MVLTKKVEENKMTDLYRVFGGYINNEVGIVMDSFQWAEFNSKVEAHAYIQKIASEDGLAPVELDYRKGLTVVEVRELLAGEDYQCEGDVIETLAFQDS